MHASIGYARTPDIWHKLNPLKTDIGSFDTFMPWAIGRASERAHACERTGAKAKWRRRKNELRPFAISPATVHQLVSTHWFCTLSPIWVAFILICIIRLNRLPGAVHAELHHNCTELGLTRYRQRKRHKFEMSERENGKWREKNTPNSQLIRFSFFSVFKFTIAPHFTITLTHTHTHTTHNHPFRWSEYY